MALRPVPRLALLLALAASALPVLAACSAGNGGAGWGTDGGAASGPLLGETEDSTEPAPRPAGDGGTGTCVPSCEDRACGSDGCGGECGTCAGKQTCSTSGTCETPVPPGVTCPPTGATGQTVGKIAKAGSIPLADGGSYDLRTACAKPVYILGVTETCGICMQELGQWTRPGNVLDQLKAEGADVVLVSTDNAQGVSGSKTTAEALRKRFALGTRFILGYEPAGSAVGQGQASFSGFIPQRTNMSGARIALILRPGNVIGATGQVDAVADIRAGLGL